MSHNPAQGLGKNLSYEDLEKLAFTDQLTGLLNRHGLERRMQTLHMSSFALMLIDIDHFKQINDTRGHEQGDQVLREVAKNLRHDDYIVSRWGGEEFIIILPFRKLMDVVSIANRLRLAVQENCGVTISTGIAFADSNKQVAELRQQADQALYIAKAEGRNRIRCYRFH